VNDILASTAGQLVQFGVLGICVLAFAWVIVRLWDANTKVQQARVDDAKANATASLEVVKQAVAAITANTAATEQQTEAVKDLRDALQRRNP